MHYTSPSILAIVKTNVAIQSGTGATSSGGAKASFNRENPNGANPHLMLSTTSAYEADEEEQIRRQTSEVYYSTAYGSWRNVEDHDRFTVVYWS